MKCLNCNGEGLVQEKLCPECEGFGYTGTPDFIPDFINEVEPVVPVSDIEHIVTEEEVKENNLEGTVEAGEVIGIPKVIKSKSVVKREIIQKDKKK